MSCPKKTPIPTKNNAAAAKASPPQSADIDAQAGGAVQTGDDAPMFMSSRWEYLQHMRLGHSGIFAGCLKHKAHLLCLGLAVLYALVFIVAERLFPQSYQAWLDFCLPLTEYVGRLTPHADDIARQLTENGYAERVDDALHGIAMSKVLAVAVLVGMLAGFFSVADLPLVYVSCTRGTHTKILLISFLGGALFVGLAMLTVYGLEFYATENFGDAAKGRGVRIDDYHRGNFGMLAHLLMLWLCSVVVFVVIPAFFWGIFRTRFTIVQQPPGGKP